VVNILLRKGLDLKKAGTHTSGEASCADARSFYEFCQLKIGYGKCRQALKNERGSENRNWLNWDWIHRTAWFCQGSLRSAQAGTQPHYLDGDYFSW
jgi:hypothetical protein